MFLKFGWLGAISKMSFKSFIKRIAGYAISSLLPSRLMRSKALFPLWERRGYHITPVHFYEPIPDTRTLKDDLWLKHSELVGIDINEKKQLSLLPLFAKFKKEYNKFPAKRTSVPSEYYTNNRWFASIDSEILYCMIRHFKPRRIFEIGSGYSTYLSAQAILKNKEGNKNYKCDLVAIEPNPNEVLKKGFLGLTKLISKEVQDVPLSEFKRLREDDILFIDSSHVLKTGGDIQYLYLEILPRLNKGVIVHIHDIFLPSEYPKEWILKDYRFWTEQYLLQAFLTFNQSFGVLWAGRYMHLKHPDKLKSAFGSYKRNKSDRIAPVSSFWLRKKK